MVSKANVLVHQPILVPFLYQTRTLRSQTLQRPQRQRCQQQARRLFSTSRCRLAGFDPIPFESLTDEPRAGDEEENHRRPGHFNSSTPPSRSSRDSTITASEQAIFDRIFADIASSKRSSSEAVVDEESENAAESFEDLNTIFNKAIDDQKRPERREKPGSTPKNVPWTPFVKDIPGLGSYTGDAHDKTGWGQPGKIGSDDVSDLAEAHKQYRTRIERMLSAAKTDVEVWAVLESEVFSLVHELNARIKEAEKAKKKKRKPRKEAPDPASPKNPTAEEEPSKPPTLKPSLRASLTPQSLPRTALLSLLSTEYPLYLTHASRLLRNSFPTSPYALHLLAHVRRLGPISYVLGASTALFNETLLSLWRQEADLHGMADLLDEMGKQGVESNEVTVRFLTWLRIVRQEEMEGAAGEWRRMWWRMGPVDEGWRRVADGLEKCVREVSAREVERGEVMEEEGEEDEGGKGSVKVRKVLLREKGVL
ncbi:hypothetical protein G7Y79_00003g009440 [Physcia stellaris]|nr:hypothetical protein G7Y79_00003g009440 [Physcia stellaris]